MSNKIIVPFNDKEGGTYELNIDLDRLSKGEMLNAIRGIGRTVEKNQRSNFTNETGNKNDLSRLPEIFDVIKDMDRTSKKTGGLSLQAKLVIRRLRLCLPLKSIAEKDTIFITQSLYVVQEVQIHLCHL